MTNKNLKPLTTDDVPKHIIQCVHPIVVTHFSFLALNRKIEFAFFFYHFSNMGLTDTNETVSPLHYQLQYILYRKL